MKKPRKYLHGKEKGMGACEREIVGEGIQNISTAHSYVRVKRTIIIIV